MFEKRVTELCLAEFLCYGPQREAGKEGRCLLRKTKDGKIVKWQVETDDPLCTLEEAFQRVEPSLGFNIELKFDDNIVYQQDYLVHVLQVILQVYQWRKSTSCDKLCFFFSSRDWLDILFLIAVNFVM